MLEIILAIVASFCWGTATIFSRLGLQNIKAAMGTLISMLTGILLVSLLALVINFEDVVHISPAAILWFSLIGIINFVLGRQFSYLSISYIGATKAAPIFSASPFFAIILAVIFIGESINPTIIIGTCAVVAGLYLVSTSQ